MVGITIFILFVALLLSEFGETIIMIFIGIIALLIMAIDNAVTPMDDR